MAHVRILRILGSFECERPPRPGNFVGELLFSQRRPGRYKEINNVA